MILVIEDNFDCRELICEYLQFHHFDVVAVADGRAGLIAAKEQLPNLIISDINLPELDGLQILKGIRDHASTARIPFIFYTAALDYQYRPLAEELGANAYLPKSLDISYLLRVVKQLHHVFN